MKIGRVPMLCGCLLSLVVAGCQSPSPGSAHPTGNSCESCHEQEAGVWRASPHALAIRSVDDRVRTMFDGRSVLVGTVRFVMERLGSVPRAVSEEPGVRQTYPIRFVVGGKDLEQYLVETQPAPSEGEIGRLQLLPVAFNPSNKEFFPLLPAGAPGPIRREDPLHFLKKGGNFSVFCIECHVTGLDRRYDARTGRYRTRVRRMGVACEACHEASRIGLARSSKKTRVLQRRDTCAACHARRRQVRASARPGQSFFDHYLPELLGREIYYPDGQVRGESYVYGSFLQSRMFRKGVVCTDCHDPHTTRLLRRGNDLCTRCHEAAKYDAFRHHHHEADGPGSRCVGCHMPARFFMKVDKRRDHSFRIPSPATSLRFGTPNSCTGCHLDPSICGEGTRYQDVLYAAVGDEALRRRLAIEDRMAAFFVKEWFPERLPATWVSLLADAFSGKPVSDGDLAAMARDASLPGIVRASCIVRLSPGADIVALLRDADPLVRVAAASVAGRRRDRSALLPLLTDPIGSVRVTAARGLTGSNVPANLQHSYRTELDAWRAGELLANDQATAHVAVGRMYEEAGRVAEAMAAYRLAIKVEPEATGARMYLAAILKQRGEDAKARSLLLIEAAQLAKETARDPGNGDLLYRYGLVCSLVERYEQARQAFFLAAQAEPANPVPLLALALAEEKLGRFAEAKQTVGRYLVEMPQDPGGRALLARIDREAPIH